MQMTARIKPLHARNVREQYIVLPSVPDLDVTDLSNCKPQASLAGFADGVRALTYNHDELGKVHHLTKVVSEECANQLFEQLQEGPEFKLNEDPKYGSGVHTKSTFPALF